jgi:TetR/AcrR family transcriptional regulator, transcriptional repressor for nem operon
MRYPPQHKAEVHRRIVKDASRQVRARGLNGAAVATVMRDTGLTHGGFYKHFESKDELLLESLRVAFREIGDKLVAAAERSQARAKWKAIVGTYLRMEFCDHTERGCPLPALAPELARVDKRMKGLVLAELIAYKARMLPFMPGRRIAEKERAFFAIFSTMAGAIEIARLLPRPAMRKKVLAAAQKFLLRSF